MDALAKSSDGLTVAELVGLLRASDSQVRRQLSALVAAGAVATLKDDPAGPGRPTLRFRLASVTTGWPEIVRMLVGVLAQLGASDDHAVLQVGRRHGAAMAAGELADGIVDVMASLGFSPRDISSRRDQRDLIRRLSFQSCPFRDAVVSDGGHAVCLLHQGLTEGAAAALGAQVELFDIRNPITAGCESLVRANQSPVR